MAREPRRGEPEGTANGPDPAAGGGPHRSVPQGERPTWRPEDERAGRRGFWRAALIVLGIIAAVWLLGHAYNLWMSAANPDPRNPMQADPNTMDRGQRSGSEAGPPPGSR